MGESTTHAIQSLPASYLTVLKADEPLKALKALKCTQQLGCSSEGSNPQQPQLNGLLDQRPKQGARNIEAKAMRPC